MQLTVVRRPRRNRKGAKGTQRVRSAGLNGCDEFPQSMDVMLRDRSTGIGSIYFFGLNSNFVRGKTLVKKNVINDQMVRLTNLGDHVAVIEASSFSMKQIAVLIKGVTAFLFRQYEVLLADFQAFYRRVLYCHVHEQEQQSGGVGRSQRPKRRNGRKIRSLTDASNGKANSLSQEGLFFKERMDQINCQRKYDSNGQLISASTHPDNSCGGPWGQMNSQHRTNQFHFLTLEDGSINRGPSSYYSNTQDSFDRKLRNFMAHDTQDTGNISLQHLTSETYRNIDHTFMKPGFTQSQSESFFGEPLHADALSGEPAKLPAKKNKRKALVIDECTFLDEETWAKQLVAKRRKQSLLCQGMMDKDDLLKNFFKNNKRPAVGDSLDSFYKGTKDYLLADGRRDLHNMMFGILMRKTNQSPPRQKKSNPSVSDSHNYSYSNGQEYLEMEQARGSMHGEIHWAQEGAVPKKRNFANFEHSEKSLVHNFDLRYNSPSRSPSSLVDPLRFLNSTGSKKSKLEVDPSSSALAYSSNSLFPRTLKDTVSVPSSKLANKRKIEVTLNRYDPEARKLKDQMVYIKEKYTEAFTFEQICPTENLRKRDVALVFYSLLVLASNDEVHLSQKLDSQTIMIKVM